MALPTTNLTLHCDASDTGQLFTTVNGGGAGTHTGTPAANAEVEVWNDEGDGIADVACVRFADGNEPLYRVAGTMKLSALDFDGTNDYMLVRNQAHSADKTTDDLINTNAFTIAMVCYPQVITATSTSPYNNHPLIGFGAHGGLAVRDNGSGVKQAESWAYTYEAKTARVTIAVNRTWIVVGRFDGTNVSLRVIDDTGAVTTDSVLSDGVIGNVANVPSIGTATTAGFFNGLIGEFAIYTAFLSGSNLTDLEDYFTAKWLTLTPPPPVNDALILIRKA